MALRMLRRMHDEPQLCRRQLVPADAARLGERLLVGGAELFDRAIDLHDGRRRRRSRAVTLASEGSCSALSAFSCVGIERLAPRVREQPAQDAREVLQVKTDGRHAGGPVPQFLLRGTAASIASTSSRACSSAWPTGWRTEGTPGNGPRSQTSGSLSVIGPGTCVCRLSCVPHRTNLTPSETPSPKARCTRRTPAPGPRRCRRVPTRDRRSRFPSTATRCRSGGAGERRIANGGGSTAMGDEQPGEAEHRVEDDAANRLREARGRDQARDEEADR